MAKDKYLINTDEIFEKAVERARPKGKKPPADDSFIKLDPEEEARLVAQLRANDEFKRHSKERAFRRRNRRY